MDITYYILIPLYNVEKYIARCINSIFAQTYKNFKVVIVNDGSTDNSYVVCCELIKNDERFKIINQENKGALLAKGRALKEIENVPRDSDYVLFIDSDDYVVPEYLETIHKYLSSGSGYDILGFNYFREEHGKLKKKKVINQTRELSREEFLFDGGIRTLVCKAFRYPLFKNIALNPDIILRTSDDLYRLLPLIYESRKNLVITEMLYVYSLNENSLSKKKEFDLRRIDDYHTALLVERKYISELNLPDKYIRKVFAKYLAYVLLHIYLFWNHENREKLILLKNHTLYKESQKYTRIYSLLIKQDRLLYFLFDKGYYGLLPVSIKLLNMLNFLKITPRKL